MSTITEKDKKLLSFLACFVIVTILGFFVVWPIWSKGFEKGEQVQQEEMVKGEMEGRIARHQAVQKNLGKKEAEVAKVQEEFYPLMESQDIDKAITKMVIDRGLRIEDMQIEMPTDPLWVIPFQDSQMAQSVKAAEEAAAAEAEDSSETDTYEEEDAVTADKPEGAITQTKEVYGAKVKLTVAGSVDGFWNLIDGISKTEKKMQVTEISVSEDDKQTINLELYMVK
ncbi:hypothetical protein M2454_000710 [Aequitasia blattaphilus]|uniref:Uncharacterized protein n=1 Tax=Aequitasia blattaphilus TaxID=2949332 RepID=A0ABT1EBM2_9FIRM|nr:hypothetical protein [Aequitasia blattaphilus]MCP1101917.1 hypothetical protein [Aequitasia blattaphilus]MCR8614557.1 hypothetical protein [Aequitasia blattaphilus]